IRRDWAREGGLLGRKHFGIPVDRRAGCEHEPLDRGFPERFQEPLRGDDVVVHVAVEVTSPAWPYAGLARGVEDDGRAAQDALQVSVDEVGLLEGEVLVRPGGGEVLLLAF